MDAAAREMGGPTLVGVGITDDQRARVKARRERLGMSQRDLEKESGVNRATIAAVETGDRNVRAASVQVISATLDRIEQEISGPYDAPEQVTNVIELPDGTRVTFVGSPENVVEAATRFLSRRTD